MAPMEANNTVRVKTTYRAFTAKHTIVLRFARGRPALACIEASNLALGNISRLFQMAGTLAEDHEWLSVSAVIEDEDVYTDGFDLPVQYVGTIDPADVTRRHWATHTKFSGRGGGRNFSIELFGVYWAAPTPIANASDGLVTASENPDVAASIANLVTAGVVSIANVAVGWKPYANVKENDYWRDQFKGA